MVEQALRNAPGLTVLATSRQGMGGAAELGWPVPPLSLPHPDATAVEEIAESAAVQLFTRRAANGDPDFQFDGDNCVDVGRVCLLLDGLPLAIELAASHAAALDPRSMVRVLDDRLRLLVDDTRGDRQHALPSTIAWSYDLLRPEEAIFFERLAVFAGPFFLEGAIAVAGNGLQPDGLELQSRAHPPFPGRGGRGQPISTPGHHPGVRSRASRGAWRREGGRPAASRQLVRRSPRRRGARRP